MTKEELKQREKNCTDCRHFGNCCLRRHKDNDEPCEDFEVDVFDIDKE